MIKGPNDPRESKIVKGKMGAITADKRYEGRTSYRYKIQLKSKHLVLGALKSCSVLVVVEAGRKWRNGARYRHWSK